MQSVPITNYVVSVTLLRRGVLDTTLGDQVSQGLATGRWFSPVTPVSSTNKTDHHNIAEIWLKVALNSITITLILYWAIKNN
jgi:hypothetical protein